jgi:hypothetical protein
MGLDTAESSVRSPAAWGGAAVLRQAFHSGRFPEIRHRRTDVSSETEGR